MNNLNLHEIHLLPYHRLAEKKYARLGLNYELKNIPPIDDIKLKDFKKLLEKEGLTVKIGG